MPSSFFFDAASDDELEQLDHEEVSSGEEDTEEVEAEERKGQAEAGEDEDGEEEDDDDDEEEEDEKSRGKRGADAQSPWDFASYSSSVGEEHARRHTTSIDDKISKAMQHRPVPISVEEEEEEEEEEEDVSDAEPDKQEEYLSEDDETAELKAEDVAAKPFFSTVDGVSFHADSFMELNLSRPLLRACETLGYKKPTPIQVQFLPGKF